MTSWGAGWASIGCCLLGLWGVKKGGVFFDGFFQESSGIGGEIRCVAKGTSPVSTICLSSLRGCPV